MAMIASRIIVPVPFILALVLAGPAASQDMVERAREIRAQLLAKKAEREEQDRRAGVLGRMVTEARQRLSKVDAEMQNAEHRRAQAAADSEQAISRLAELDGVVGRERAQHRARVAGLYRAARIGAGAAGWTGASSENVRLARYLVTAAARGQEKVARLEIERGSHLAALDRARAERDSAASIATALQSERFALESEVARAESEAQAFASNAQDAAAGVAELEASAKTLEKELAAVTPKPAPAAPRPSTLATTAAADEPTDQRHLVPGQGATAGTQPALATREPAGEARAAADPAAISNDAAATAAPAADPNAAAAAAQKNPAPEKRPGLLSRLFRGGNADADKFASRKGSLAAPVGGKVVASYGQQHKSGNTYRGVIVRSKGGAPVRTVAEGQVIFSGSLSGMGNTVIVSHGGRYHSVYARLGSLRFQEGDRIGAGDVVGNMPGDDPDLHFELRDSGQAVDPLPWVGGSGAFGQ
ncbi:MAG TPA: peptidoglycan DD-metalloendopeptidase family protein [Candidatus Binatia bacterium]|nr:peptidoglycan DD-metalloendopeptidase family protein [Candidatus Binatia bacterium]